MFAEVTVFYFLTIFIIFHQILEKDAREVVLFVFYLVIIPLISLIYTEQDIIRSDGGYFLYYFPTRGNTKPFFLFLEKSHHLPIDYLKKGL